MKLFIPFLLLVAAATAQVARQNTNNTFTGYNNFVNGSWRPPEKTVATLPAAAGVTGKVYVVTDGLTSSDCTVGMSSTRSLCVSTGSAWVALGGGGSTNALGLITSDYNFTRTPGGSISIGVNVVTLTSCPLGVNGTDSYHYFYLSGGTGTAETVLMTGGTCTSGATTGTVIFTAANIHSGAFTVASASGGLREAIIHSGGNAIINIPTNTTLTVSGLRGVVCNGESNLTIIGAGFSSILQSRASSASNHVFWAPNCDGLTLYGFTIDGNRAAGGTNPTFGSGVECGFTATGGCNHVSISKLQIKNVAKFGIVVTDTNSDITIRNNWIHHNGGVTDATGAGTGVLIYRAVGPPQVPSKGVIIDGNELTDNYNTITTPVGGCVAVNGNGATTHPNAIITNNHCYNNWNEGGQLSTVGATTIANNLIETAGSVPIGLTESTSGIEVSGNWVSITGNIILNHSTGSGIAIEGDPAQTQGETSIVGNVIGTALLGISILDAGGTVRGVTITGNRIYATTGVWIGAAAHDHILISSNNFLDSTTPINDNSANGVMIFSNAPWAANKPYAGTIASAATINMRCGQVATISGTAAIDHIVLPPTFAVSTNGQGCSVTLIPTGAFTTTTAGNIGKTSTAVVGKILILTTDNTVANKFYPSY